VVVQGSSVCGTGAGTLAAEGRFSNTTLPAEGWLHSVKACTPDVHHFTIHLYIEIANLKYVRKPLSVTAPNSALQSMKARGSNHQHQNNRTHRAFAGWY
jgi:hypothetical protein